MIVRTDAVVLHAFDYGETSRIVRLLTRQHGVIGALARGARRTKSTFGSTLQPGSYIQAVYYHRPQRGLQTLKEASHVIRFKRLAADIQRLALAFRVIETTRLVVEEGEAHPLALDLVVGALAHIDDAEANVANAVPWFQIHLLSLLGFAPAVEREDVLALGDQGGRLDLDTGAVVPAGDARGAGPAASRAALRAFAVLARTDLDTAGRMRLDTDVRQQVDGLVGAYVRAHTESTMPERVRDVVAQMEARLRSLADQVTQT
ncbi:MAG: DNA repair protein RecO [Bacteroidota bacterium]